MTADTTATEAMNKKDKLDRMAEDTVNRSEICRNLKENK
jgi:hypothetical protein